MKKIKKYFVFAIVVFSLFIVSPKAAIVGGCIDSGTSLKGKAKIGTKLVGSNYYYSWNDKDYEKSYINLNFCTDVNYGSYDSSHPTGTTDVYFAVDYCSNSGSNTPGLNIWSSFDNSVDFTYRTNTNIYLSNADWSLSPCFRSFIHLKLNYSHNIGTSVNNFTDYSTNNSIQFGMYASYGYSPILRYQDLIYYDKDDYDKALSLARQENKQDQTNSKLNDLNSKQDQTNDTLTSEDEDTTSKKCGVVCKLKGIFTGIIELPKKIVTLIIDALKSLFVPTDDQLYEIVNDSKELSENFGFVGEAVAFFLNIFTSLLGMVNANGCIEMPAFKIGATSLFDEHIFWEARNVCLADNLILSANITTIRSITSIVFVSLFVGFATRKFFSILSKSENEVNSE